MTGDEVYKTIDEKLGKFLDERLEAFDKFLKELNELIESQKNQSE